MAGGMGERTPAEVLYTELANDVTGGAGIGTLIPRVVLSRNSQRTTLESSHLNFRFSRVGRRLARASLLATPPPGAPDPPSHNAEK